MLGLVILVEHWIVTDGRTDRLNDGKYGASLASRG